MTGSEPPDMRELFATPVEPETPAGESATPSTVEPRSRRPWVWSLGVAMVAGLAVWWAAVQGPDSSHQERPTGEPIEHWAISRGAVPSAKRIVAGDDGQLLALATERDAGGERVDVLVAWSMASGWSAWPVEFPGRPAAIATDGATWWLASNVSSANVVPPDTLVHASRDGGASWAAMLLPTEAVPPTLVRGAGRAQAKTRLAAADGVVVVSLQTTHSFSFGDLAVVAVFGPDVRTARSDDGIDLLTGRGRNKQVVASFTYEELGLDGPRGNIRHDELFVSSAGGEFQRVEWPFGDQKLVAITAVANGFVATLRDDRRPLWWSPDGRLWDPVATPPIRPVAVGSHNGRLVVAGNRDGRGVVLWEDGTGEFETVAPGDVLARIPMAPHRVTSASIGPLGVSMVLRVFGGEADGPRQHVAYATSAGDWYFLGLDAVLEDLAVSRLWTAVGSDSIVVGAVAAQERSESVLLVGTAGD